MPTPLPEKVCATCGRRFSWRRKWADVWDEVRYCSRGCRGGPGPLDRELERAIVTLLAARAPSASICPSEAARTVVADEGQAGGEDGGEGWRREMERTRRAGRWLAARGIVRWTKAGREVDPSHARGPVRFVRGPRFSVGAAHRDAPD